MACSSSPSEWLLSWPATRLERLEIELEAEHRGAPQQRPAVGREVGQPPPDHLAHLDREVERPFVVGPSPATVVDDQAAGVEEVAEELDEEERVPLGDPVELVGQVDEVVIELVAGAGLEDRAHAGPVEPAEVDPVDEIGRAQLGPRHR